VGGAEQACFRTAILAQANGYSNSIVTTRPDNISRPAFPARSVPIVENYLPAALRRYVEAVKWYSVQFDPLATRAFRRILRQEDPDVIHFHNFQFLTLSLIGAAKESGKGTIASIYDYWLFCPTVMLVNPDRTFCERAHGPWCVDCLPPMFRVFQKLLLSVRRRVFDRYMAMLDGFHVLSDHSRSVLEGYGIPRKKIHVAPLTLPLEFRKTGDSDEPGDPHMILFAGWLNERKGLHRLLQAMPLVLKEHPKAHLTAIGGNVRFGYEYEKKLSEIMDAAGFRDRVRFTGHLPPSEIKEHIEKAAVVVIPEQYENMSPLLMIETMSLAKPVVISRVGGVPEFIEHGVSGWMADPLDAVDFADKILKVLEDQDRANAMGLEARQRIMKKCDDSVIWEKTRAMYESVAT